ncbi:serine protease inhibitor 3/4-like [Trichoplusia ni]|uniref:Serine protease inhibitor 3/4-like n=1 Tax=Trichoplusia ni TaxID=7111 RepID=A0A7E5VRB1_TRINI|nr:serine protease inhibitor 3/4-like [Trichoplusia ni]
MKLTILVLCTAVYTSAVKRQIVTRIGSPIIQTDTEFLPDHTQLLEEYRNALHNFTIKIYKRAAFRGNYHFVISPHSLWMTLAGVAEGTDLQTQSELFELLSLPADPYLRKLYYDIAATRFSHTNDVRIVSTRALVIDEGVQPNPHWHHFVSKHHLLSVVSAPIRQNSILAANAIRQIVAANFPALNLHSLYSGNSVLLDTLDYNGLWTTAFADAVVRRAPFYDRSGNQVGSVDLMRVKRQGKIGYVKSIQAKVLELPIGINGQFSMVIALVTGDLHLAPAVKAFQGSIMIDVIESMKESKVPIDVAIPQFRMNTELDARIILQDLNITRLWTDPEATRYISDPPALPSSYVQRSTVTLAKDGVFHPPPTLLRSYYPEPEDQYWSEFIANRPFMFGLFDTETYTCLMGVMYTQPTYPV